MKKYPQSILFLLILLLFSLSVEGQVVISEFNASDEIELKNIGNSTVDIANYWLCQFPDYDQIKNLTVICGTTMLGPGEELSVMAASIDISGTDGELGLYTNSSFDNSGGMIDYVEWGNSGHTRSSVAAAAGIWTSGTTAPAFGNMESLNYDGDGNAPSDWTLGASSICVLSSVTESFARKIKVEMGPVPTREMLNVKIEATIGGKALGRVVSLQGQELLKYSFSLSYGSQTENIDVSGLPPGMYILLLDIDRQRALFQKFVKQ